MVHKEALSLLLIIFRTFKSISFSTFKGMSQQSTYMTPSTGFSQEPCTPQPFAIAAETTLSVSKQANGGTQRGVNIVINIYNVRVNFLFLFQRYAPAVNLCDSIHWVFSGTLYTPTICCSSRNNSVCFQSGK